MSLEQCSVTLIHMIARLRGLLTRLSPGEVLVDVEGVGYRVHTPVTLWEALKDGTETELWISSYVREDRFDLYGFVEQSERMLFERFLAQQGIGPKLALELCSIPQSTLLQAIQQQNPALLLSVKGVGKKKAEKILLDLRSLADSSPELFALQPGASGMQHTTLDPDAIEALQCLGYSSSQVLHALQKLSPDLTTTEDRVTAALQTL